MPLPLPAVGARVRCEGLTGAAEWNGCLGRVVSHEGARAQVLTDGGRVVGVRPQNLVVVLGLSDVLQVPGLFAAEVLGRLSPTDLALLRRVDRGFRAAPLRKGTWRWCSGRGRTIAPAWDGATCAAAAMLGRAAGGSEVGAGAPLPLDREHLCRRRSGWAALKWAREHGCPWNHRTCEAAVAGGHTELLRWARAHGCPG